MGCALLLLLLLAVQLSSCSSDRADLASTGAGAQVTHHPDGNALELRVVVVLQYVT